MVARRGCRVDRGPSRTIPRPGTHRASKPPRSDAVWRWVASRPRGS